MEDDAILVARAQSGNTDAFARLYDRHVNAIYRYISLRVPTQEQAEDLTEDVFLRAWQHLARYRPERPFLHWLYRIAHNRLVDEHRSKAQKNISLDALAESGHDPHEDNPPPLARIIAQEDVLQLRQALTVLSPDEQTLLTLRFTEGMAYKEIAAILNKSEGACRVMQHRALKKLADELSLVSGAES